MPKSEIFTGLAVWKPASEPPKEDQDQGHGIWSREVLVLLDNVRDLDYDLGCYDHSGGEWKDMEDDAPFRKAVIYWTEVVRAPRELTKRVENWNASNPGYRKGEQVI